MTTMLDIKIIGNNDDVFLSNMVTHIMLNLVAHRHTILDTQIIRKIIVNRHTELMDIVDKFHRIHRTISTTHRDLDMEIMVRIIVI